MKGRKIVQLIICLLIPLMVGGISGYITADETRDGTWYSSLNKPSFNPPNFVFAPVWTVLYLLMGVSLYMVWNNSTGNLRKKVITIFAIQLFFNFCWSILFFYFHLILASVVDIVLLWFCILWMIFIFHRIKPVAGYLQIPYIIWVSFASMLDISIWLLNK
jgi:benzodiazapine receptor